MLLYLGWIVAAFLAGVLLTLLMQRRVPSLQQRVNQLGVFAGRSYAAILKAMRGPQLESCQSDGQIVRTWRNRDYSISLRFDNKDIAWASRRRAFDRQRPSLS